MGWHRHALIGFGFAGLLGCGPQRLGNLDDDGASSSGESTSATESTEADTTASTEDTTESTTDPTETSSTETTATFVPFHDVWLPSECDPWEQDCPEGEKCVPYASTGGNWDANKCVPVMGDQLPGEPCSYGGAVEGWDDCDASSWCWDVMDVDGENVGECTAFCMGMPDAPECPPQYRCVTNGDGTIALCIPMCDPILQDCDPGLGCFWTVSDFQCIVTTEDVPTGSPCGFINDCVAGNICTAAESLPACDADACCAGFCDLDQGDVGCEPQPGTACVAMFERGMALPGFEHIGICQLP